MSASGSDPSNGGLSTPFVHRDPRRWVTLAISVVAAFIVVLDNGVLYVALPTMMREFDTSLSSIQWVITGYALTFASLLIIGGRLGDVFGHRRIFMIGTALFGVGSLIAALSQSVPELVIGEAIIEGVGASLMLPATIAILSGTFEGRERATAFGAWGATAGVAAAAGPVIGGFLTTYYSWRWSFGINVIVAPLALVGAFLFMDPMRGSTRRMKFDIPGAVLVSAGLFLLVFALSQGATYGWWAPRADFSLGGVVLWPETNAISIIPVVLAASAVLLASFVVFERWKERRDRSPLFEAKDLRFKTYRYGLLTNLVFALGLLGIGFVLPEFLQTGRGLTAAQNGLWLLPAGFFVILGAQLGRRVSNRWGTTVVVRSGLALYAIGVLYILRTISLDMTAAQLLPGLALYGVGAGFAGPQLTNVVLIEIPSERSGVASGVNATVRQVGMALGAALIGALLTALTISNATAQIADSEMSPAVKAESVAGVDDVGAAYEVPEGTSPSDTAVITDAVEEGVLRGARASLIFTFVMVSLGCALSFSIPNVGMVTELDEELEPDDRGLMALTRTER